MEGLRSLLVPAVFVVMAARAALALPVNVDADRDGVLDTLEVGLGSNPADAASQPESAAQPPTCLDGADNDADGSTDLDDPGCTLPTPVNDLFPAAGTDVFASGLSLDDYPLATASFGTCLVDFAADGPTVVNRSAPVDLGGGLRRLDVEIVAMQLTGTAAILPGGTCTLPPGEYPVTLYEDPAQASVGQVSDVNADPGRDFPADSFFDVFFQIETSAGVLPGGPPNGPPGSPVRVENGINSIPPYHGGQNSLCYQVQNLGHEHCPKAPPDHYTCYTGRFTPKFAKRAVLLRDQFHETGVQTQVRGPVHVCNPTAKNGEPLYEPTGHLECFTIKPEKLKRTVTVRNQFGVGQVTTKKARLLCVPSEKNGEGAPQELDHFECYDGKFPRAPKRAVTLVDQFGTLQTQVVAPRYLCNPVDKNGEGIRNRQNHLACYAIKPRPVRQTVTVANQFGERTAALKKAVLLCAPSSKLDSATTTTTLPPVTTTTLPPGRRVILNHPFGSSGVGQRFCLSDVTQGGCVGNIHTPFCACVHLHDFTGGVLVPELSPSPVPDPEQGGCGFGCVEVTSECPPDTLPSCS